MIRLIRAEFLKLRTTQVWFWLLLGTIAVAALLVIAPIAHGDIHDQNDVAGMFSQSSQGYILVFVLGVLGVTTEFRYQTITPTVLQTPSRWAIITAKLISYAIVGALYALAAVVVQIAIAAPWLAAKSPSIDFGHSETVHAVVAVFAVMALFGIVGLGVGALLRNQVVAVVVGIVFLLLLENLILLIPGVRQAWPYTPGAAARAILHTTGTDTDSLPDGVHLTSLGTGVVVLLLWAFVPAIVGAVFSMNRDIT